MLPSAAPRLFVSIFAYVLGKEAEDAETAVAQEIDLGKHASWPAFRTLWRLRQVRFPIALSVSHSSLIAKARSLALGKFLASGAPLWLSLDDDVEASEPDLRKLLASDDVDVLVAPCALRGPEPRSLNIVTPPGPLAARELASGVRCFPIASGGLALSVMTRAAAEWLWIAHPHLRFVEPDERQGLGVFLEDVREGAWWGEDYAFCRRVADAGMRLEALCGTSIAHAGVSATVDPHFAASLVASK